MKKLILLLLVASLNCLADPVSFSWLPNPETDQITGYRLYTGSTFSTPDNATVIPPSMNHATIDVAPGQCVWLTAFRSEIESAPAGPLCYHAVVVELVLEGSKGLPGWVNVKRWELLRIPDVLFTPGMTDVLQVLEMTRERVGVRTPLGDFKVGVDTTGEGKKFFRSYVAARPL